MAAVRRIQDAGIEVMAGMIVGFDHDDEGIFADHLRFLEEARIPIAMTGMLQAPRRTPLYERMRREGRLLGECGGDQFGFTNIRPARMSVEQLYRGYRALLTEQYSYRAFRRRCMSLLLGKRLGSDRSAATWEEVRAGLRALVTCVLGGGAQRAWFSLSILLETLWRRPSAVPDALTLVALHKHFHEYTRDLCRELDDRATDTAAAMDGRTSARVA